ncbi:hypothetical protein [Lentzea xinjiangensis]|nr:hypothetical protein [Lentzea xinjiangensis]
MTVTSWYRTAIVVAVAAAVMLAAAPAAAVGMAQAPAKGST